MARKIHRGIIISIFVATVISNCATKQSSLEDNERIKTQPVSERLQQAALSLNTGDVTNAQSMYQEVLEELLVDEAALDEKKKVGNKSKSKQKEELIDESRRRDYLSTVYTGLGVIAQSVGDYIVARESFEAALETMPDNIAAQEGIALITLNEGDRDEAEKLLLDIMQKTTQSPRWRTINALGVIADLKSEYSRAVEFYQQSINAGGPKVQALNNQGYSYLMAGKYDQALQIFSDAQAKYPDSERIKSNLALTYARLRKYDEARSAWSHFLSEEEAWNNAGYVAMMNGDFKIARQYFETAIKVSPRYYPKAELNLEHLKQLESQK